MRLRRSVRTSLSFGSQVIATVESYASGFASVRVAGTGSRLTNLPCTSAVTPGDTVIVDYSAEGTPVVRPQQLAPDVITPAALEVVTKDQRHETEVPSYIISSNDLVSARVVRTASMSLEGDNLRTEPPHMGSTVIPFTDVVWQTHSDMAGASPYIGIRVPVAGRYFCRLTVAFSPLNGDDEFTKIQVFTSYPGGAGFGSKYTRMSNHDLVLSASQIISLGPGSLVSGSARFKNHTYSHDPFPYYCVLPADPAGAYPLLEVALISPYGADPRGTPYWYETP